MVKIGRHSRPAKTGAGSRRNAEETRCLKSRISDSARMLDSSSLECLVRGWESQGPLIVSLNLVTGAVQGILGSSRLTGKTSIEELDVSFREGQEFRIEKASFRIRLSPTPSSKPIKMLVAIAPESQRAVLTEVEPRARKQFLKHFGTLFGEF